MSPLAQTIKIDSLSAVTAPEREQQELAAIGQALRAIRRQKGLTLRDVERLSGGNWKAVVVGSYERGDRALTLKRAVGLASFYEVPLDQLLGISQLSPTTREGVIFSLTAMREMGGRVAKSGGVASEAAIPEALIRYLQEICRLRSDWNGEVLSVRSGDLIALSVIANTSISAFPVWAIQHGLLLSNRTN